jgi:hypothetical protein
MKQESAIPREQVSIKDSPSSASLLSNDRLLVSLASLIVVSYLSDVEGSFASLMKILQSLTRPLIQDALWRIPRIAEE